MIIIRELNALRSSILIFLKRIHRMTLKLIWKLIQHCQFTLGESICVSVELSDLEVVARTLGRHVLPRVRCIGFGIVGIWRCGCQRLAPITLDKMDITFDCIPGMLPFNVTHSSFLGFWYTPA